MKQLKKYADNQYRALTELLSVYELTMDQEVLHRIRVELKKIKAIFHLISYCTGKFNVSKEYSSLKIIFRKAGRIREIDVANKLYQDYHIKNIKGSKTEDQDKLISEFRQNIPVYKKTVTGSHKKLEKYFERVNSDCYKKYLNIKKEELQKQIYPLMIESKLHKSRKIIKEIYYLSGISRWRKNNLDPFYNEVQDIIGKWHDKQMLMSLIHKHDADSSGNVVKKLNLKSRSDLKTIEKLIKKFYCVDDSGKMVIYKNAN
ncbi:MAG: CHAD domain-containing protein [Ignavibacteria bacterium]|nr:CHAD domain-containing protein [Ignavibacteria bacterium]